MSSLPATRQTHAAPGAVDAPRRRRSSRSESRRLTRLLAGVACAAAVLVAYVFAFACATQYRYDQVKLRAELRRLRTERKHLEAELADLKRMDRVLYEAKRLGMQPRDALQYVSLLPEPQRGPFQQASARP